MTIQASSYYTKNPTVIQHMAAGCKLCVMMDGLEVYCKEKQINAMNVGPDSDHPNVVS
jgi:Pyruvate/2-oxoacid:ferredoxin oxidoreductase delta subunit